MKVVLVLVLYCSVHAHRGRNASCWNRAAFLLRNHGAYQRDGDCCYVWRDRGGDVVAQEQ